MNLSMCIANRVCTANGNDSNTPAATIECVEERDIAFRKHHHILLLMSALAFVVAGNVCIPASGPSSKHTASTRIFNAKLDYTDRKIGCREMPIMHCV